MKKASSYICLVCALLITLTAAGCSGGGSGKYRVIAEELYTESFAVGFRAGDPLRDIVNAAMKQLVADGTAAGLSTRWFGKDVITLDGDSDALAPYWDGLRRRTLIVGFDPGSTPMSFKDQGGGYTGFDIEFASALCSLLGWEIKLQPIAPADIVTELISGNIDCAWGGMGLNPGEARVSYSEAYMENSKMLISLSESKLRSKNQLSGKTLATTFDPSSDAALNSDEKLKNSLASIARYGDVKDCFNTLEKNNCDAILVDSVAFYYLK